MKALVYTGANQMELRDMPQPKPGPGQVIVDVHQCGICGSDMHAYHGHDERRIPPLVLGHEAVGYVRDGALAGKRVAINPMMTCKSCPACLSGQPQRCPDRALISLFAHGAFAEAVAIDEANLTVLPDSTHFSQAVLAEPLAVCVHACRLGHARHDGDLEDPEIAVLGGGAIGLLAALTYQTMGVKRLWIAEPNATRRKMLEQVLDARAYDPMTSGPDAASIDIVFDAVGSGRTRAAASALVRPGGTIVHTGLQDSGEGLAPRRITLQEITFVGTYCYRNEDFAHAVQLLSQNRITGQGWTEFRPLADGARSFQDIDQGLAPPKIILTM